MGNALTLRLSAGILALGGWLTAASTTAYLPVCCNGNSTVSIISTSNSRLAGSFSAGPGSYAVTFPTLGSAWVTNTVNNTISIVSLVDGSVHGTIQLNLQPWLIQSSADGSHVYVVTGMFTGNLNEYTSYLEDFNVSTGALRGAVALPNDGLPNPGLAVSPDGNRVYATFDSQTVVVYDTATRTVAATWQTTRALTWTASGTLTLSPDAKTLYTAGQVLTAIDTATGSVTGTLNPPGPSRTYSFVGSAINSDGTTLYASYAAQIGTGGGLAAIDIASLTITATAGLGSEPQQPVLSKDASTLYVPDAIDSVMYVVNASSLALSQSIAVPGPVATATLGYAGEAVYVPNGSTASMLAIDPATFAVLGTMGVSGTGNPQIGLFASTAPSATSNGKAVYVAGIQANSISRINAAANQVVYTYTAGTQSPSVTGVNPPGLMVTPNGRQIYLTASDFQGEMTEIDTATGAVNGVPCPIALCEVTEVAALPDSSRVYLAGFGFSDGNPPRFFYVVDTATLKIVAAPKIKSFGPMAASPTGKFLYISTGSGISVFDTTQNAVTGTLPVAGVAGIAFSPDGSTAYAVTGSALEIINTSSGQVTGSISLGSIAPVGIAVTPDGTAVWISLSKSTSVMVVNLANQTTQTVNFGLTVSGVAFGI